MSLGDWLKSYSKDLNKSQSIEAYAKEIENIEGKKVDDWSINIFLRYFYKLRNFKWPDLDQTYNGRYIGNMKSIVTSCKDNKQAKEFIDNLILNFDAIKDKHWQFKKSEYPELSQVTYNKEILINDLNKYGFTTSRTHRVSKVEKQGDDKKLW